MVGTEVDPIERNAGLLEEEPVFLMNDVELLDGQQPPAYSGLISDDDQPGAGLLQLRQGL